MIISCSLFLIAATVFVGLCGYFAHSPSTEWVPWIVMYGWLCWKMAELIAIDADILGRERDVKRLGAAT